MRSRIPTPQQGVGTYVLSGHYGPQPIVAAVVAVSIPPGDAAARFHVPADNLEMEQ